MDNDTTKAGMNMGGAKFSSAIGNVKANVDAINQAMLTAIQRANTFTNQLATNTAAFAQGISAGYGPNANTSPNLIFNQPAMPLASTFAAHTGGAGGMGGAVGNNLYNNRFGYGAAAVAAIGASMPSASDAVNMNYLTTRSLFYGMNGMSATNNRSANYNAVSNFDRRMAGAGTITSQFDAQNARFLGQANGIGMALPGYSNIMKGVAEMSNLTPGLGMEGSMQAFVALQQPGRVNMMKVAGIQARDPITGQMKSPTEIAEQIWNKLNREKIGGQPISKEDIAIGLEPGNSLDAMMKNLFGNDEYLVNQITAALYAKASGAKNFGKKELRRVGGTTSAITSQSERTAASMETLQRSSRGESFGVTAGNKLAENISDLANAIDKFTGALTILGIGKGLLSVLGGIGPLSSIGGGIAKLFGGLFKAEGGPVSGASPYIVGEKGPELFVPKTNGTIIPNHALGPYRENGGAVSTGGSSGFAKALLKGLGVGVTADNLDALQTWMRFEGGGGGKATGIGVNTANWNPLNTTLRMDGSKSMNKVGVQSYTSMSQGLEATIATLTGASADKRGYTGIIDALKSGDKAAILEAIDKSAWRTGKTGGSGAYNWTGKGKNSYGGAYSDPVSDSNPTGTSMRDLLGSVAGGSTLLNSMGGTTGGGSTTNNNYGGVSIVISGNKSPKETAEAVKKIFEKNNLTSSVGAK